ncbi:hypothetical protein K492DRAFT_234500 [Lichtheimia hyalospora FSU 10163]|nr:hypothetical protein K492DRAFT_234500 [Lichtheimia hyalospora FSU 10163]
MRSTQQSMQLKPVSASSSKEQYYEQRRTSSPKLLHHQYPRRTLTVDPHTLQLLKSADMQKTTTTRKNLQSIFLPHDSALDKVHQIRSRAKTIQRTISTQTNRSSTISPKQSMSSGSKRNSFDTDDNNTVQDIDQFEATSHTTDHLQQNNDRSSSKRDSCDDKSNRSNKRFKATHPYQQPVSPRQHSNDENPSGKTIFYTAPDHFPSMSLSPESPNVSPLNNDHQDDSCDEIVAEVIEGFHVRTPGGDDGDDDEAFKITGNDNDKENTTTLPHFQLPANDSLSWTSSDRRAASDMRHQLSRECSLSPIPFCHHEPNMLSPKRQSATKVATTTNSFQASNENNSPRSRHCSTANQENDPIDEKGTFFQEKGNINPFSKVYDTPISRRITLRAKDNQYQNVYRHSLRFDTTRSEGNIYQYSPTEHLLLDRSKGWSAFRNL